MNPIKPPIDSGDTDDHAANLQGAPHFLLRDTALFFDPEKTPAADQLKAIKETLQAEASTKLSPPRSNRFCI